MMECYAFNAWMPRNTPLTGSWICFQQANEYKCSMLTNLTDGGLVAKGLVTLAFGLFLCPVAQAGDAASAWSRAQTSAVRLVSAGGLAGEVYDAGIEIALSGNSLTYGRTPGDSGVPPTV